VHPLSETHEVKTQAHRVENSSCHRLIVPSQSAAIGEAEAGSAGEQPARNNRSETHRHDEQGAAASVVAPSPLISCILDQSKRASSANFPPADYSSDR
ncbi:MAG: hypothetical protein ACREDR_32850, partial [Blastocatellia bacterium]